jgi:hypothetical protein
MPIKNPPIAFLHRVVKEGPTVDTGVRMTRFVAQKSPAFLSGLKVRVHGLKLNSPSADERVDSIAYFFRTEMFNLN